MSNPFAGIRWLWMNGELIEFDKATVHVLSHGLHYGSGAFEGIRCYDTVDGPAVFRLREHIRRLEKTCKIYRMPLRFSGEELAEAVLETIRANELGACYIRPLVWRGFGHLGVDPLRSPVETAVAAWKLGKYLGEDADEGIDVCVSSWRRVPTESLPSVAKATGNYLNGTLVKMEAVLDGYAEGIALDVHGFVSEGSGENVFLVQDGALVTPPQAASLLPGITRDTVVTLAHDLGIPVRQEQIARGGPVTVTHPDMIRYFMTIPEAVSLILQAGAMAEAYGTYVLEMGRPVAITELARKMIEIMGAPNIKVKFVGLRPGEKLKEELSEEDEERRETDHQMVFRLHSENMTPPDGSDLSELLEPMISHARNQETGKSLDLLRRAVPNYSAGGPEIKEADINYPPKDWQQN